MKQFFILFQFLLFSVILQAQDRSKAQEHIDTLCSKTFFGRGYVNNGHEKAALYIEEKMKNMGLLPLNESFLHDFPMRVNTFPEKVRLLYKGEEQDLAFDFLVSPYSGSVEGTFELAELPAKWLMKTKKLKKLSKKRFRDKALLLPPAPDYPLTDILNWYQGPLLVQPQNKFTWSVGKGAIPKGWIWYQPDSMPMSTGDEIQLSVKNSVSSISAYNVAGVLPGMQYPDSVIVLCGHYDHLGGIGTDVWFPGANDNASGIAMLLDLAEWFSKNPQPYTLVFIAFGGEEVGLIGSKYFVDHPPKGLETDKIKFLFNMDLMGSGEKGATIVNATVFPEYFKKLEEANEMHHYLPEIKQRGKAANSDHYFYSEAGVPSFFMYLMGDFNYYHEPLDNAEQLKLGPYYDRTFMLIRDYIELIMR